MRSKTAGIAAMVAGICLLLTVVMPSTQTIGVSSWESALDISATVLAGLFLILVGVVRATSADSPLAGAAVCNTIRILRVLIILTAPVFAMLATRSALLAIDVDPTITLLLAMGAFAAVAQWMTLQLVSA